MVNEPETKVPEVTATAGEQEPATVPPTEGDPSGMESLEDIEIDAPTPPEPPKEEPAKSDTFKYFGVKFPSYFKNPRFVQTADKSFTIAVDADEFTMEMKSNWNTKYLPELADLTKKVLQKLTKEKIKSL